MAYEHKGMTISLKAAADQTGKRYLPVKVSGADQFAVCGAGEASIGFMQNEAKLGEAAAILINGISFAKAGGAITAGADVMAGANGVVVAAAAPAAAGTNYSIGTALQGAVNGDIISVLLQPAKAYTKA